MSRPIVLKGVSLLGEATADLVIRDGVIVDNGDAEAIVVEASGLIALPGLVDLHTHLREPGREDAETIESGSRSAARGGFTAVQPLAYIAARTCSAFCGSLLATRKSEPLASAPR